MLLGLKSQTYNFRANGESLLPSSCKGSPRAPGPPHVPASGRTLIPPTLPARLGSDSHKGIYCLRGSVPPIVEGRQMLLSLLDVPCRQKLGVQVVGDCPVTLKDERSRSHGDGLELVKGLV